MELAKLVEQLQDDTQWSDGAEMKRLDNLTKRMRQILNMTPEQYVESTRPTVELEEAPWTRPPNARTARMAAIETIARELALRDEGGRMVY